MHRAKRERLYLKKVEAECLEKGLPMPVPQADEGEGEGGGAGVLYPLQFRNHPQACSEYPGNTGRAAGAEQPHIGASADSICCHTSAAACCNKSADVQAHMCTLSVHASVFVRVCVRVRFGVIIMHYDVQL